MSTPYELLNRLQESKAKSKEEKLEEEARRKLEAGEELSSEEQQVIEKPQSVLSKVAAPTTPKSVSDKMDTVEPKETKSTSLLEATKKAQQKTTAPGDKTEVAPPPTPPLSEDEKTPPAKKPTIQETLQGRLGELKSQRKTAKTERETKRREADWGELASIIGRSLAQIGAAQQGLRTGVDLSKSIGPALIDWEKRRDRIDADYDRDISLLNKQADEAVRIAERAQDKQDREEAANLAWDRKKEAINLTTTKETKEANAKRILASTKALMAGKSQDIENQINQNNKLITDYDKQEKDIADLTTDLASGKVPLSALMPRIQKYIPIKELERDETLPWSDDLADPDEIIEMLTGKAATLRQARQETLGVNSSLQKGLVKIKSTTPEDYAKGVTAVSVEEPSMPQAPVKLITAAQLSQVAKRDGVSEAEAKRKLEMLGYTIRD